MSPDPEIPVPFRPRPSSVRRSPSVVPAALGVVLVAVAAASIGATTSAGASAGAHRGAVSHATTASVSSVSASSRLAFPFTRTNNGAAAQVDAASAPVLAKNPVGQPQAGAAPLSFDDPIQGGLTAHQEQALSAAMLASHRDVDLPTSPGYWTPALGRAAVARAESWLGMPYSWAGGNGSGPTAGVCDPGTGGDLDCHITGFDCSGLTLFSWAPYAPLAHFAQTQASTAGAFHPSLAQLMPGDLVFFSAYLPNGIGHVAIYTGHGMVIEAPQSGQVVHRARLADLIANDGVYRGATRPLTGATPVLAKTPVRASTHGGSVTLHGVHLNNVTAVRVGDSVVRAFTAHTDDTITFLAPAHAAGAVVFAAVTPWNVFGLGALTYVTPKPTVRPSAPRTSAPGTGSGSTSTAPSAPTQPPRTSQTSAAPTRSTPSTPPASTPASAPPTTQTPTTPPASATTSTQSGDSSAATADPS